MCFYVSTILTMFIQQLLHQKKKNHILLCQPHKNCGSVRTSHTWCLPTPSPHTPPSPPLTLFQYLWISSLKQFAVPALGVLFPPVCECCSGTRGKLYTKPENKQQNDIADQCKNKRINVNSNELYSLPEVFPAILNLKRVSMLIYCTQKRNIDCTSIRTTVG